MKKRLTAFLLVLVVVLCASYVGKNFVLATRSQLSGDSPSTNGSVVIYDNTNSGAVSQGCPQKYDTCYGLTWRWYPWPDGADEVTISGNPNNANYLPVTISGAAAQVCKEARGYYRYAFVNRETGEQYGTMSLAAHPDDNMKSEKIVGEGIGAHYRGPEEGGENWDTVVAAYNDAKQKYPEAFVGVGGFERGSGLRLFCASKDDPPTTYETTCASHVPESQTKTYIWTEVQNKSINSDWVSGDNIAYVGVGQTADWRHCYYPGVQKLANKKVTPTSVKKPDKGTCSTIMPHSDDTDATTGDPEYWDPFPDISYSYTFTNKSLSSVVSPWENRFSISRNSFGSFSGNPEGGAYSSGDAIMKEKHSSHDVDNSNVSGTLTETATTGTPTAVSITTYDAKSLSWQCKYVLKKRVSAGQGPEGCNEQVPCGTHKEMVDTDVCQNTGYRTLPDGKIEYYCKKYKQEETVVTDYCGPEWDGYPPENKCHEITKTERTFHYPTFYNGTEYVKYEVKAANASSYASVGVPINYSINSHINLSTSVFYAGESAAIDGGTISNRGKWNNVTKNTYATNASNVRYKLISYVSDTDDSKNSVSLDDNLCTNKAYCKESSERTISSIGANSSVAVSNFGSINIPDVKAGNYFCVALAYSPTNSGYDTNLGNWNGNLEWGASNVSCKVINKKPIIQVWGSGVYSAGVMDTNLSKKNNVSGVKEYEQSGIKNIRVFGSWAEQAVISAGKVTGLASGASLGSGSDVGTDYAKSYCKYEVPLSFANYNLTPTSFETTICPNDEASGAMTSGTPNVISDRAGLVDKIASGNPNVTGSTVNIDDSSSYTTVKDENGRVIRLTYSSNSFNLAGVTLGKNITHVVRSNGKITIGDNLYYDTEGYTEIGQVPKLIIYATNIDIKCAVNRIDAVLITTGNVNTCSDSSDKNARANSNQLKINGTIIANRLIARRTYGNSPGAGNPGSATPAEIVNYDSSIVLWTSASADTSRSDTVNVTYQRELSPRY